MELSKFFRLFLLYLAFSSPNFTYSTQFSLAWPTPNPSFAKGLGYHTFLQKTGPDKDFSSGAFGCVRNDGYKFHEGIDLFPVRKNGKGHAEDTIFAAMDGVVVYISRSSQDSAYGIYIVIEHENLSPVLYTLYAHLEETSIGLSVGQEVSTAQAIGRMGNTASFHIPLNRSHLHFEIGIRLSNSFDKWYNRQRFKSKNKHGNYNGYNLVGLDPLEFYSKYKSDPFQSPAQFVKNLPTVTKVQLRNKGTPFIVESNSVRLINQGFNKSIKSWICSFGPYGFPISFEASNEELKEPLKVLSYDMDFDSGFCRKLITSKNGKLYPSDQLLTYLELIFLD